MILTFNQKHSLDDRGRVDGLHHPKALLKLERSWKVYANTFLQQSEQEYEQALVLAEKLTFLPVKSPGLTILYHFLVQRIEAYEAQHYPMASADVPSILQHLLEASQLTPEQLATVLGSTLQQTQALLSGQQAVSPLEADRLGRYFQVDPSLFLETGDSGEP